MKIRRITKNVLLTVGIFLSTVALSILFQRLEVGEHITTIFAFAVFLISLLTDGYAYGVVSAICGMLAVNYAFTYPYFALNFNIPVNLISAVIMITVSILTGMLTTKIKNYEIERAKNERERMRANLLRAVSHDLRTPLTTILGAADTLLESPDMAQEDRQELIEAIDKDARWLIRMTENLLSVTKCGTGVALKTEDEVVEEIVSGAVVKFKRAYPQMPIAVHRPQSIMLARMDALLIEQVLMNLFENAAVHGETTTRIDVDITADEQWVRICVRDDGAGFPPAMLKNPFGGYRAHEQQAGRRNMGIGLSACRAILRAHGGDISAANGPGGGAEVAFWLPGEEAEHG